MEIELDKKQLENFWGKVDIRGDRDCWMWKASKNNKGYGTFSHQGKTHNAHRISWILANKRMPGDSMYIIHSCDTPGCVNPKHLREGTPLENNRDMWRKGRARTSGKPRKLTTRRVKAIRSTPGTFAGLARQFGVNPTTIRNIIHGKAWKNI